MMILRVNYFENKEVDVRGVSRLGVTRVFFVVSCNLLPNCAI